MLDVDYHSSHRAMIEPQKSSPFELSLDWTVTFDKGPYNGRKALAAEKARGPLWRFVGIEIDWDSFESLYVRMTLRRRCRAFPGAPASRSIATASRSVTPRAAAGRRS